MKHLWTIIAAVYTIAVLLFAFNPAPEPLPTDKLAHFTAFLVLTLVIGKTLKQYRVKSRYLAFWISLGIGLMIELIQLGIPARSFSLLDFAADIAGAVAAMALK